MLIVPLAQPGPKGFYSVRRPSRTPENDRGESSGQTGAIKGSLRNRTGELRKAVTVAAHDLSMSEPFGHAWFQNIPPDWAVRGFGWAGHSVVSLVGSRIDLSRECSGGRGLGC
jgi:hypothetical protein